MISFNKATELTRKSNERANNRLERELSFEIETATNSGKSEINSLGDIELERYIETNQEALRYMGYRVYQVHDHESRMMNMSMWIVSWEWEEN